MHPIDPGGTCRSRESECGPATAIGGVILGFLAISFGCQRSRVLFSLPEDLRDLSILTKSSCRFCIVLALLAPIILPAWAEPTSFSGEVAGGATVVHQFAHDDQRFEFRLRPSSEGWIMWIGDPSNLDRNFLAAATPPFRDAVNPAVIQGWHFRNSDNSGPNEAGPKNVDAPQERRDFAFVLDSDGFVQAQKALEILLRPGDHPEAAVARAQENFDRIPKATGTLRIDALELSNLEEGERAAIGRMAFTVSIDWPSRPGQEKGGPAP